MSKKDSYRLNFSKVKTPARRIKYSCSTWGTSPESYNLAVLLDLLSDKSADDLLEEINNALEGKQYESIFTFDVSGGDDSVQILPTEVVINSACRIGLEDMKRLLEEWREFINS